MNSRSTGSAVASGNKGPQSLYDQAKRQCMRYSHVIHDVGTAPFDLVAPILKKMSAKQLVEIENKSPQIKHHSEQVWKKLVERDFSDRPMPSSKFRKTYIRYFKEKEAHLKDASVRLRESMERLKQERAARTITSLEVDPMAAKAHAKRKLASTALPGSKLIQKAIQTARSKGPIYSSKNIKFSSNVGLASKFDGGSTSKSIKRPAGNVQNINPAATQSKRQHTMGSVLSSGNQGGSIIKSCGVPHRGSSTGDSRVKPVPSKTDMTNSPKLSGKDSKQKEDELHIKSRPTRQVSNIFITPRR